MSIYPGIATAGTVITVDDEALAIVTSMTESRNVEEVEVTGPDDTVGTAPDQISFQRYRPISINMTYAIEGFVHYENGTPNEGYTKLKSATEGQQIELVVIDQQGYGDSYPGFLTNLEKAGSVPGLWTFTAQLRVTDNPTAITPGS
jgi:hypothetical protein